MVDALEETWRVLARSGRLIDLRPSGLPRPLEVLINGVAARAGEIDTSAGYPDDEAADSAIESMVARSRFERLQETTFPYRYEWDQLDRMRRYIETEWSDFASIPAAAWQEAERIIAANPGIRKRVRVTSHMHLGTYQKI